MGGRQAAAIGGCLLLVAACGGEEPVELADAYRDAPRLTLVEERRFCADELIPECQLDGRTSANVAPDGGAFIWNPSGPIVRFDSTGAVAARYGRPGEGPGEYRMVYSVHAEPDGRVVLYDFGRPGRVVFAADGTPLVMRMDAPDFGIRDLRADARGFTVLREPPGAVGDSVLGEIRIIHDTLPPVVVAALLLQGINDSAGMARLPGFFGDVVRWAVESDTSALVATGPTLRVTRHFADGRKAVVVDAPTIGNRAVTSAEVEAERVRQLGLRPPMPGDQERLAQRAARSATVHQFAGALRTLGDGAFLLRERAVELDSARWTLFDREGAVVGQLRLGARAEVVGGDGDRLLLVTPDERDVPIVAWYRLAADAP